MRQSIGHLILILNITLVVLPYFHGLAQTKMDPRSFPKDYFRPPLDLSPQASGSFGELRSNHFHSGTDYRTNQRIGYPVYAVADGFISRLRVQIGGGGNIVYIDHPNGYTSVYMHLDRFNSTLAQVIKEKQYTEKQFAVDFKPAQRISVKKGEVIAFSGNTGGSSGPHLHFELRNTETEETLNTQLFGLTIPDRLPPILSGFTVFRLGEAPFSENTPREHLTLTGSGGQYRLSGNPIIEINGKTGFGVVAVDPNSASANKNGIYCMELLLDDQIIFKAEFSGFFFHHSRAINSYIDYATYIFKGRRIQKAFVEPGNPLTIYSHLVDQGLIDLQDENIHQMQLRVLDVQGNTSTLDFRVKNNPEKYIDQHLKNGTEHFRYDQANAFATEEIKLNLPAYSLYSDLHFLYGRSPKTAGRFSATHHIHNRMIPLHTRYTLHIKPDGLPKALESKALLVDVRGRSHGGTYKDGYVSSSMGELGSFYIDVDTEAPTIRALNISSGKSMSGIARISFKITDNLSGIQSFNGYIDGQWVLMQYDPKSASLWHTFEKSLAKGKHHFRLEVKDWKNNEKIYEADFMR